MAIEGLLLLALIAIPVWYLMRPQPAIAFASRDWVVVGDLKNLTGQKVFDDSLQAAFHVGLAQSRYVNVLPDLQVRGALKRMERDPATTIDRTIGSEIALREHARALILPTIAEIGGRVRLTAEVVDPTTQTSVYSDSVDGSGEDSVLPSMDTLLRKMRGRLGESLSSIGETSAPLAEVTTKNLDALKAYSVGLEAMVDGKGGEAISLFGQAIELDPDFALAYLTRGGIYLSTGQKKKAHDDVDLAMRDVKRLSARERLLAEANAAWFDTPATMREKWTLYAKLHPDDAAGVQNLALVYWWFDNDLTQAARYFREVTASQHPRRGVSWLFLGDTQVAREQLADAATSYAKAREVGTPQLYLDPINRFIAARDSAGAEQALAKEDTHSFAFFESEKQLRTAAVEVGRGRLSSARAAADAAAQTADRGKLETSRQRARLAALAIAFAAGDAKAGAALEDYAAEELQRLQTWKETYDLSPFTHLSFAATLALRHGDHALADQILASLKTQADGSGFFSLEQPYRTAACEAGIERDAAQAVACLEGLVSDRAYYQTRVALLRAYVAAGNDSQALAMADWLAQHRGAATAEVLAEFTGQVPNLIDSDAALVDAVQLEQKAGKNEEAAKRLAQFTAAWAQAEGDPPLLRRARQLEAKSGHEEHR
jgi:putative peptide modification system cyclase